jgi:hypothetical protein
MAEVNRDQDWQAQAQREKERLSQELDAAGTENVSAGELPAADFLTFVSGLATQAMIAMGQAPDPFTGEQSLRLDVAMYHIDLLGILAEKTKGNLSPEEDRVMQAVLSDLRMTYVAVAQGGGAAPAPGRKGPEPGAAAGREPAAPGESGRPGKIILPG